MKRRCERLSKFQRRATPLEFCRFLVNLVRPMSATGMVAVLWVERKTPYWKLWPDVELWGKGRDALTYAGPHPVICHPPCGPWGNYKAVATESKQHGVAAMSLVHRFGGVVEQPVGSSLFSDYGNGGEVMIVDQGDYGHLAKKRTALYVYWG